MVAGGVADATAELIKPHAEQGQLSDLAGKRCGVDISGILVKAVLSRGAGRGNSRFCSPGSSVRGDSGTGFQAWEPFKRAAPEPVVPSALVGAVPHWHGNA